MRVIIFRHGLAGSRDAVRWPDDGLRPLTSSGRQRTRAAARGLARLEPDVRLIGSSPLTRARQTADLLAEELDWAEVVELGPLCPGGSQRKLFEFLAEQPGGTTVALVGHEPDLGKLAGTLLFPSSLSATLAIKKAGACAIDFEGGLRPGAGRLLWLMPPKLLRRLAGKKQTA
jgi:phosphohistidine phosphatase